MVTRRHLLQSSAWGLGSLALGQLLSAESQAASGVLNSLHHTPKAKRVIFLFQAGGPSQLDLFDHKPVLNQKHGQQLPASVRGEQRLTGMSGNQSSLPLVGSPFKFAQHGQSGTWMSELLPHTAQVADEISVIRSVNTEAINHGPGVTYVQTGSQIPGRPCIGSWLSYGLGTENDNLPAFVVLVTANKGGQPLAARLWGNGFLPSHHQGVQFRSGGDPVLYLNSPEGIDRTSREKALASLDALHRLQPSDSLVDTRIRQYELAFRMQASIPEVTDLSTEPEHVLEMYGPDSKKPGTFAANCLLARRLAEKNVRFIQLYHQGWDHHGGLPGGLKTQCSETDQPAAALIQDLKQRGMLDETLVVWGGEFGRTNYCQGKLGPNNFGRDHHGRCFSVWMAGGGIKGGVTLGETDEYGFNIVDQPVHIHDLQATIMHVMGIDHERLTFRHQGRAFRLTDVHGHVVQPVLA
ncbi:DUF1501 domain-containing protein [Blastopirellula marina]|uniref:Sulfatase n=1 Tax=Blastopirellula marina TaxID=124 RepID=A0A2S8G9W8_9BACT|nr:DUF1501 domain-containing protein [Blastopirellula marina]PQO41209.1 sulfatase [Blastopirellula marina]PTL46085.1 DUF1501 domain-containing protein [Blastopirellula marina]